jgi:transcriptional regulator with XRE-family HTH domain
MEKTWFEREIEFARLTIGYQLGGMTLDIEIAIREAMREQGITQAELASRLGTSAAYVSKVLNGSPNMTLKSLVTVAHALGLRWRRPALRPLDSDEFADDPPAVPATTRPEAYTPVEPVTPNPYRPSRRATHAVLRDAPVEDHKE